MGLRRRRRAAYRIRRLEVMDDTWINRELPILVALVTRFDDPAVDQVRPAEVIDLTGLDGNAVLRGLTALCEARPAYLEFVPVGDETRAPAIITGITSIARRAVGAWPSPESMVDRLVEALTRAAEQEPDLERKSKLHQTALWLGGVLRDVAVQTVGTVVGRQIGL